MQDLRYSSVLSMKQQESENIQESNWNQLIPVPRKRLHGGDLYKYRRQEPPGLHPVYRNAV